MKTPLRTERSFVSYFFLNLITLGIYGLVQASHISDEINLIASKHDGKSTMNFCWIFFIFSWLTFGIAPIVWYHRISNRIGKELYRRGINYEFDASTFWLWAVIGSAIVIGPYVYISKRCRAMNLLNADFNEKG